MTRENSTHVGRLCTLPSRELNTDQTFAVECVLHVPMGMGVEAEEGLLLSRQPWYVVLNDHRPQGALEPL